VGEGESCANAEKAKHATRIAVRDVIVISSGVAPLLFSLKRVEKNRGRFLDFAWNDK
jgi:hypothetical protein